jgi:hypothetical protein
MASSRSSYEAPDFVPVSPKPSVRFAPGTRERPRRPSLTDQVQINVEATVNATGDLVGKTADLVGKGANAVVKETKKIADGTGKELQKLGKNAVKTTEMLAQKQHGYLKQIGDSISEAVAIFFLQRFLARIGVLVTEALIDAEMPNGVQHLIQRSSAAAWEVVSQQVRDSVHAAYSYEDEAYLDMVSRFRTGAPSFWPKGQRLPQPYTWFRARLLHTLMPCDATFWSTAFDPVAWIIRIASVTPVLSALMMVFLFFAIRKRDEYQLINYITMVRANQALIVGVYGLISGGIKFYHCLNAVDISLNDAKVGSRTGALESIERACGGYGHAPGYDLMTQLTFSVEPFRLAAVYASYWLLLRGYARGGKEHLHALERVRLDAADGEIDGHFDEESAEKLHARRVDDVKDNDPEPLSEDLMWRAAEAECQQLQPRYGLHMKWLIAWDVGVFAILVVLFAPKVLLAHEGSREHTFMIWSDIFYANIIHSVLMMPFILLLLPIVSTMLTSATPTGYDKSGHLGGMLTPAMMERKREHEAQVKAKMAKRKRGSKIEIDTKRQSLVELGGEKVNIRRYHTRRDRNRVKTTVEDLERDAASSGIAV